MTVLNILKLGSLELINKTKQVHFPLNKETQKEINDMKDTLISINGSTGLSANQLGINKQILVYRINEDPIIFINPNIDICSTTIECEWEECYSIPTICAVVPRYKKIHISGFDEKGVLYENVVDNFHARNFQHTIDYLNGINIFERIIDKTLISYKTELHNGIYNSKNHLNKNDTI